ncbi:hypothetical protein LguiA_014161 [Lonicera macranthoides]
MELWITAPHNEMLKLKLGPVVLYFHKPGKCSGVGSCIGATVAYGCLIVTVGDSLMLEEVDLMASNNMVLLPQTISEALGSAIEKVLESIKVPCRYTKYGCKETVTYSKIHDHERMCIHSPCTCPLPGCVFTASSECVYRHVRLRHANSTTRFSFNTALVISLEMNEKYVILQEKEEGIIFTLNHDVDRLGSVVNVNCIGPSSSKRGFSYDLIARNGGCSVKSQYSIESVSNWCPCTPRKAFLLVPNDMVGSRRRIELQLSIWKEDRYVLLGN